MIVAHLSDLHVGSSRYEPDLLRAATAEINDAEPDLVVVTGDLTEEGYREEFEEAKRELDELACERVVVVPGDHDAKNVGYLRFQDVFGERYRSLRFRAGDVETAVVAVDSSTPDDKDGHVGREHYEWLVESFAGSPELRIFACHHHLLPVPGTGRKRNTLVDAGDVLSLLRASEVNLALGGHRHVPYVWPIAGMLVVQTGTVSARKTRLFADPAYTMIRVDADDIEVELCVPGSERIGAGRYPRSWPEGLAAREADPLTERGIEHARA